MVAHKLLPLLLLALTAACGSSGSTVGLTNPLDADAVVWVGIDQRPLAVGAQVTLTFQLPAGRTSTSEALTVDSSDPNIVAVTPVDLEHNRVLVQALSPGEAVIELQGSHVNSNLPVVAAVATQVDYFDENYLAAGMLQIDLPKPPLTFGLLTGGQQVVGAILEDADQVVLNSRGLARGSGAGAVSVTKEEPEMFILSPSPALGVQGTFNGGLPGLIDAPFYIINLADSIAQVVVVWMPTSDNTGVVAVAQAEDDNGRPIFGVTDWTFQLNTSATSFVRLSPAAIKVLTPATAIGPVILTATAQSEGMSGSVSLFQ